MKLGSHGGGVRRRTLIRGTGIAAAVVLACFLLASCGSSSKKHASSSTAIQSPVPNYVPTGPIVAESSFRPNVDGFSFPNYESGEQELTPAGLQAEFGTQVCVSGSGSSCVLTAAAQEWMNTQNQILAQGHCFGFSVTAILFFENVLSPKAFGGNDAFDLHLQGNTALQEQIAEDTVYKDLPTSPVSKLSASQVINALIQSFRTNDQYYTLGINSANGSGGHAITPFAIEDKGGGHYVILVYDNNWPGIARPVMVNTNNNSWYYNGAPTPQYAPAIYAGSPTNEMLLIPTSPVIGQQPCPFCYGNGEHLTSSVSRTGSTLTPSQQYTELNLIGNPDSHAQVTIRDSQGREAGILPSGTLVDNIPGVKVIRNLAIADWQDAPSATDYLPLNQPFTITINATALKKPDTEKLTMISPGFYSSLTNITLVPGQIDRFKFLDNGTRLIYLPGPKQTTTPILAMGIDANHEALGFAAGALNVVNGTPLDMTLNPTTQKVTVSTDGQGPKGGSEDFVIAETRITQKSNKTVVNPNITVPNNQVATLAYGSQINVTNPLVRIALPNGPTTSSFVLSNFM